MADKNEELTFSGEEILEKEKKRKILIYSCIGLGILAIILTILLILRTTSHALRRLTFRQFLTT